MVIQRLQMELWLAKIVLLLLMRGIGVHMPLLLGLLVVLTFVSMFIKMMLVLQAQA